MEEPIKLGTSHLQKTAEWFSLKLPVASGLNKPMMGVY
jgi:hypothetical protein